MIATIANVAKDIGIIVSCATGIVTFLALAIKPLRKFITDSVAKKAEESDLKKSVEDLNVSIKEIQQENEQQTNLLKLLKNGDQAGLGNSIKHIYYKYNATKSLPIHEREALALLFPAYVALDGDNYVDGLMDEMKDWETIV